jgi:ribosomal protein L37AE/L43A
MKLFRHLRRKYLAISVGSSTHFQKHFDHCPHCEEKTPWMARVMSGYYRCLQCGNDPLVAASETGSRTDAASSASDRSSEAGGTGRERRLSA